MEVQNTLQDLLKETVERAEKEYVALVQSGLKSKAANVQSGCYYSVASNKYKQLYQRYYRSRNKSKSAEYQYHRGYRKKSKKQEW